MEKTYICGYVGACECVCVFDGMSALIGRVAIFILFPGEDLLKSKYFGLELR